MGVNLENQIPQTQKGKIAMNRNSLRNYLESAFDYTAMEDALLSAISDLIDYDQIADNLLAEHADELNEILMELAEDMA